MKKFSMKKTTAAAVAAAVGAALLLGGAGTLAYWSDTETSATQTISSGSLDLGTLSDGTWTVTNGSVVNAAYTGAIVPGDKLTKTVNIPVTLSGQNINATLAVTTPAVNTAPNLSNADLASALTVSVASVGGDAGASKTFTGAKTATPTVPVVITVEFPFGTTADASDLTELKSISFTSKYTLTQIAR